MAQPGIGMGKLTSGLFWIDSDTFANLDSRAIWYILKKARSVQSISILKLT